MDKQTIGAVVGFCALAFAVVGGSLYLQSTQPVDSDGLELDAEPLADDQRPNVIIILWDTTRADRLSLYGYDLETTPRMRAWAEKGVIFENAVSPAMWTVPSHASMFTGLPPTTHGAGQDYRWLDHSNVTLAEHFRDNGYDTYAFSANPNLTTTGKNLLQGFETVNVSWGGRWRKKVDENTRAKQIERDAATEISPSFPKKGTGHKPFTYNAGPVTQEAFGGWLLKQRDESKPFLAYLSYMESHKPRIPTLESRQKVADQDVVELALQTDISFEKQLAYSYDQISYTDKELEAINRTYDACLIDLDNATGDLLDQLEQRGYLENTIVIFTSDHGEMLGEHQLFGHRASVFEELLHVPLVISWPGHIDAERVAEPVSNLDIYNTLIELAGVPRPEQKMSMGNLVRDAKRAAGAFAEMMSVDNVGWKNVVALYPDLDRGPWTVKYRSFRHGDHKLIRDSNGVERLFHLGEDPGEHSDLSASSPDLLTLLQGKLDAYLATVDAYDPAKRTKRDLQAKGASEDSMTKEKCEMMRDLGYIEGDCDELPSEADKPSGDRAKGEKAKNPRRQRVKGGKGKAKGQKRRK